MGSALDFSIPHLWTEILGPFPAKSLDGILQEPFFQLYHHQNHRLNEQPYPVWEQVRGQPKKQKIINKKKGFGGGGAAVKGTHEGHGDIMFYQQKDWWLYHL